MNPALNRLYYARSANKIAAPFLRELKRDIPDELAEIVGEMLMVNYGEKWTKDYAAHQVKYDPITNYDRHEERDQVRTPELQRNIKDTPAEVTEETSRTEAGHRVKTDDTPAIVSEMRQETPAAYTKKTDVTPAAYTDKKQYDDYQESVTDPGRKEHESKQPAGYVDSKQYNNYREEETPAGEINKEIPGVYVGEDSTTTTTGSEKTDVVNNNLTSAHSVQGFNAPAMRAAEQDVTSGGTTETRTPNIQQKEDSEGHISPLSNPHQQAEAGANINIKTGQPGSKTISGGDQTSRTYNGDEVTDLEVTPTTPGVKQISGGMSDIRTYQSDESQIETYTPSKPGVVDITPALESPGTKMEEYTPTTPESSKTEHTTKTPGDRTETESGTDTVHEVIDAKGNIGVTTSQQMLQSEYDLNAAYIFFEGVMADIDKLLTIGTFRRKERPRRRFW